MNKKKLLAVLTFFVVIFSISNFIATELTVDAAYLVRCAYGRCQKDSDCDDGAKCIDMNGDGLRECDNGICKTDADCKPAANGGVAVCRDDNGDGLKECANAFCPRGKTIPGANCDCSAGRTCGQTCDGTIGLCGDGKSTCRYIVGPSCRDFKLGVDETTYCFPGSAPGTESKKCVARDQYNSYGLYNGNNPSVSDLSYLCNLIKCVESNPNPAILNTPANNANVNVGANDSVDFTFNVETGWGSGCPKNVNTYDLQLSYNCTGTYTGYGQVNKVNNLIKGGTYCWRVVKDNGNFARIPSVVNRFTVVDDRVNVSTASVKADVCGAGFSGQAGISGVSNPIDYSMSFSTGAGNTFKEIWLAMVPDNTPYNKKCSALKGGSTISNQVCQNMESADTQNAAVILQKVANSNAVAYKMILNGAGNVIEARAYNGTSWNSIVSAGNVLGLGGTLLEFQNSSAAFVQNAGTVLNANFRIRLDTVPLGKYAFYIAAVISDVNGNIKTSYSSFGNSFVFKRVTASPQLPNWGVDLTPPAASGTFNSVKFSAADKFQVNWGVSEANTVQLKSYVTRDTTDSSLKDTKSGDIDFGVNLPNVDDFNKGILSYNNLSAYNGYINETNLATRTYQDADPTKQSNYQFYIFAKDLACNQKVLTTTAGLQKPWVLTYNGNLSAGKGITGLSVPTSLDQLSEDLKSRSSSVLTDKQSTYLSSYGVISGNADLPVRKQSKTQQFVTNYEDLTIKPPLDSGFSSWYDYFLDLVNKNSSITTPFLTNTTLNGNTSAFIGTAAGTKKHVVVNGNLTVTAGSVCDTQTIFFVKGNKATPIDSTYKNTTLKITPDFSVSGNNNGCLFVTTGDILIDNGGRASLAISLDSTSLSNYDLVEAALVTDSQLITTKDITTGTEKGDGLAIKGSVVTENLYLQRDINLNANQLQPSQVFYFDPRYREIFKNDLHYNKYSLREVGYNP